MGRRKREVARDLARGRARFGAWRKTRKPKCRIPEPLWALAVELADKHGLHPTAAALRLDYYSLKKRVEQARSPGPAFIELGPVPPIGAVSPATTGGGGRPGDAPCASGECVIELEDGAGRMRVILKGYDAPDVAALARGFWRP